MQNKIDIPGTTISLEIIDKIITVTNKIKYDIQMQFKTKTQKLLWTQTEMYLNLYFG